MARTWRLFSTTSHHCRGWVEGSLLLGNVVAVGYCQGFTCELLASLVHFATNIAAVTIQFFISLPSLVNCSYLNLIVTFCASNFPLQLLQGKGSEQAAHGLEHFGRSTKLGNTIPKP